jgi:GMP synthase-like glutamine amidotransferase
MTKPALVLEQGPTAPPGLLATWLEANGIPMVVHRALERAPFPDPREHAFVAVLGSRHNPNDVHEPEVAEGLDYLRRTIEADVPVLGLCYGGQLLATALGGTVENASEPELGWYSIDSDEPDEIPAGPWLQWHFHRFTTPPDATEVARSPIGPQAFRHGPHLGVQFHPESTIEIVAGWARKDAERLAAIGVGDAFDRLEKGRGQADVAARNAHTLFDGFWERTRTRGETDGAP